MSPPNIRAVSPAFVRASLEYVPRANVAKDPFLSPAFVRGLIGVPGQNTVGWANREFPIRAAGGSESASLKRFNCGFGVILGVAVREAGIEESTP